jgi:hypothetical protein
MDLETLIKQIIDNPLFQRLKNVEENNSYHDHEKTYDHLIKTYETAKQQISGDFITNSQAKKTFIEFGNTPLQNLTNAKIMLLTALLHDIGKILYYREDQIEKPLRHEDKNGLVSNPGHEYWGSTIVGEFLKDLKLSPKIIEKIANVIRLHDTFGAHYFNPKLTLPIEEILDDVKARAEGFYLEALFNVYCDCFTAKPFEQSKQKVIELFNQPSLYCKREYFIK